MILLKQALRSVWRNKKAYLACVVLMAVGIAVYVSFNLLFENLSAAMNGMYQSQRFGDGFAAVAAIPLSAADRAGTVDGVARLDATLVADARVLRPGSSRIITLRLCSFDPEDTGRLNDFIVVEGTLPGEDGILVGEEFAAAGGYAIGDTIPMIIEGREYNSILTGTVQSPEYVYAIPDSGTFMPDNESFGFGYMEAGYLGTITGKSGVATNLSFTLDEGATFSQVKAQLEDLLAPYGMRSLIERKDQPSHAMLEQEVDSIEAMSTSLPMMFIFMAVVILYIMLKRIIEQERGQIGTLKAFGFSDRTILLHYMGYGGITGLAGGVVGVATGILMTGSLTEVYLEFFSLPALRVPPNPLYVVQGLVLSLGSGLLGAYMGTRGILKLSPSEAMRPPAPPTVRGDIVGRLPFLRAVLSSHGYMAVRNITRNKFRSGFVVVGVAFSFAITAFMASYSDMFDTLLFDQFTKVELYNLKISLQAPLPYQPALENALSLESVRGAEGLLEVPVEARSRHLRKDLMLTALQPDSRLYRIYDNEDGRDLNAPTGGVIVSSTLADDLSLRRGNTVTLRTPYTGDRDLMLPVLDIVHTNLGSTIYLSLPDAWDLLEIPPTVTALLVDSTDTDRVKDLLLEAKGVSALTDQDEAMQVYVDLLETYGSLITMMQLAGVIIAFAIITNTASISLSERKREYATMRVLGMHPREIGQVVAFEYWVLTLVAIPPGILLTRLLKEAMSGVVGNDMFSLPVTTQPGSYLNAAILVLLTVALSNWLASRRISKFDMVEVLKERE